MKFLTFLNSGCIDICKNMLLSAQRVGIDIADFTIACLDKNAFNSMMLYPGAYQYADIGLTEYQNWTFDKSSNFRSIVKNKWKIIYDNYQKNNNLIWVDTDIVFRADPRPYLKSKNILFQTDLPGSYLCSGFMVFNDTPECQQMVKECSEYDGEDDQLLVNSIALGRYKNNINILDPKYFPNGKVYYQDGMKQDAMIVHNNWMVGVDEKIRKFKEEGLWYL